MFRERSSKLFVFSGCKNTIRNDSIFNGSNFNDVVIKEIVFMKERLKIEDLESFNYNQVLDNVLEQIKLLKHQKAFDEIIKALNHYRELDIGEIRELIDDTESRSKLFQ